MVVGIFVLLRRVDLRFIPLFRRYRRVVVGLLLPSLLYFWRGLLLRSALFPASDCFGGCFGLAAVWVFFATEIYRRERKVLCLGRGAEFGIGAKLSLFAKQERLRGGRLLFPLRRKK
jgi:hypothetical protein